MLKKLRKSPKLFSDFDTLQFASVMAIVVFVVLLVFMTDTTPMIHHGVSADLPKVWHPVSMPGAVRDDMMKVTVLRDGRVYFGSDQIVIESLAERIQNRLKDRGVERKVYIVADERARWDSVKLVLDGVRSGGIIRVAFLVNQRRLPGTL